MNKKRVSNILFYLSLFFILLALWNEGNPYLLLVSFSLLVIYKFFSNSIELKGGKRKMKRKINKKLLMFGILGIFALALVSAALVGYISNSVQADVTVESPMQQWISTTESNWQESISLGSIYGGESVTFYTREENFANVPIKGDVKIIVTGPINCVDFKSVVIDTRTPDGEYGGDGFDLMTDATLCDDGAFDKVVFSFPVSPLTWGAGQVDLNIIVVTFKTDSVGTYTLTNRIVPA